MNINLNFKNLCSSLRELLKEKVDKSDLDKINDNVSAVENSIADISAKIDEKVGTEDLNAALENKVDKEFGKGLSSNDYTDDEKTKLSGIEEGANKYSLPTASSSTLGGVKVDTILNTTSTNPVQNKVVTVELNNIKSKTINGVALSNGQNLIVPRSSKSLLSTQGVNGTDGYIKFATITALGNYVDHPHYFRIHIRNEVVELNISLLATESTSAKVNHAVVTVGFNIIATNFYYANSSNTTVDLYFKKRNAYDSFFIEDYLHADKIEGERDKIEFKSEFTTTLPEGAVLIPTKADPDEIANSIAYNLVDTSLISSSTGKGITRTNNNDGSITYTGTSTATTDVYVPLMASETIDTGTYIFSPHAKTTTTYFYQLYKGGSYWKEFDPLQPIELTEKTTYSIGIAIKPNTTINETFYPMLEKGATAHDNYVHFTGGKGSIQKDINDLLKRIKVLENN